MFKDHDVSSRTGERQLVCIDVEIGFKEVDEYECTVCTDSFIISVWSLNLGSNKQLLQIIM